MGNGTATGLLGHQGRATSQVRGQEHPSLHLPHGSSTDEMLESPRPTGHRSARRGAGAWLAALPEEGMTGQTDSVGTSHLGTQTSWQGW